MVPKLIEPGETANCPGLVPFPDSATLRLASEASDANVTAPLTVPTTAGAKTRVRVRLCPGGRVSGEINPLRPKPAPVTVA